MRSALLPTLCGLWAVPVHGGVYAHYAFDTGCEDSSPNRRHGTLVDTGVKGNSGIITAPGRFKFGGGAMNFGADRDIITIPPQFLDSGRAYTIAFWARRKAGDTGDQALWDMVIGQRGTPNFFIGLGDGSNGGPGLRWRGENSAPERQADFAAPNDSLWHHHAIVASGQTVSSYLDGELTGTATGKYTGFAFDTIGDGYGPTRNFGMHGQLDELWIFDEALDAKGISRLRKSNDPQVPPSMATRIRVYLLAGQSNADGRANVADLPPELQYPQPDVDFYYKVRDTASTLTTLRPGLSKTLQFGPEVMLGNRLAKLYSHEEGTRVAIIKYAHGGTNLHTHWKAGGDGTVQGDGKFYVTFQQTVKDGLAALAVAHPKAKIDLDAMVWMQGEADAAAEHSPYYESRLKAFVADLRATFGPRLPVILGQLSTGQIRLPAPDLDAIRSAQDAVGRDHLSSAIILDDVPLNKDSLHFNAAGQMMMGSLFAAEAAYYAWMAANFSPEDIMAGLAAPEADRDGDGQRNRAEFIAGSDPLSATSLHCASFSMEAPGEGRISYPTVSSRLYGVEKFSEAEAEWFPEIPATLGSGGMDFRILDASQERAFYRVSVDLQ